MQVAAVSFKAPSFWTTNATAWFIRLEAAFATHQPAITNDLTKFHHVVQLLDSESSRRVLAVLENPPVSDKYTALKNALLSAYEATQFQKDTALLSLNGLGGRRPTELLQHMRSLNKDPATLFKALFLQQLPPEVRRILAQAPGSSLDELAKIADGIIEADTQTPPFVASISPNSVDGNNIQLETSDYEVNAIRRQNLPHGSRKHVSKPTTSDTDDYVLCRIHAKYGPKARSCKKYANGRPCAMFENQGN
jgi:hypothetical protein